MKFFCFVLFFIITACANQSTVVNQIQTVDIVTKQNKNESQVVWKTDFSKTVKKNGNIIPKGWKIKGTSSGVPKTKFSVIKNKNGEPVLHMLSEKGIGGLMTELKNVDLNNSPIMRWKWKTTILPKNGDGRKPELGDQACEIYVLSGSVFSQKCIAYTWETDTPKETAQSFSVFLGAFKAKWFCLRNKTDGLNKWYVEERNVAKDFKDTYGFVPKKIAVMAFCKADKTKTKSESEIAFIEFLKK